jgi:hypothetical protein
MGENATEIFKKFEVAFGEQILETTQSPPSSSSYQV